MIQSIILSCASILLFMHAFLSFNVSKHRVGVRTDPESDQRNIELRKAIRAHGNASEYNAIFIALFLYFSLTDISYITVAVCVAATACRVIHAIGLLRIQNVGDRHPLRYFGALGTYAVLLVFAVIIVVG